MRNIPFAVFLFFVACAGMVGCSQPEEFPLQGRVVVGIPIPDSVMNPLLKKHRVPGVSLAVITGGKILWARGYGALEQGKPERVDLEGPNGVFMESSGKNDLACDLCLFLENLEPVGVREEI
jgi:hypothetical protein